MWKKAQEDWTFRLIHCQSCLSDCAITSGLPTMRDLSHGARTENVVCGTFALPVTRPRESDSRCHRNPLHSGPIELATLAPDLPFAQPGKDHGSHARCHARKDRCTFGPGLTFSSYQGQSERRISTDTRIEIRVDSCQSMARVTAT